MSPQKVKHFQTTQQLQKQINPYGELAQGIDIKKPSERRVLTFIA
jgi:hypothetical protein